MKPIASFTVNHDTLRRGVYISRIDGDVVTYDIRMKKPNCGEYLENAAMHTIEHLFATFARNSEFADKVIYVGPMGCRTGFYLLMRDSVGRGDVLKLIRESFEFMAGFEGDIPGTQPQECGNYCEHDAEGARAEARAMLEVLRRFDTRMMDYNYKPSIGIIGAMESEVAKLRERLSNAKREMIGGIEFICGELYGHSVVIARSGIGKVNAARCTQMMIDKFSPDYILNTGIAGGVGPGLAIGDAVIGHAFVQHDFDVTALGYAKGYLCTGEDNSRPTLFKASSELAELLTQASKAVLPDEKVKCGIIATGDLFVSDGLKKREIHELFGALATEMEGAAIAQTAKLNGVPFTAIRAISDLADGTAPESIDEFGDRASEISSEIVVKFIELLDKKGW